MATGATAVVQPEPQSAAWRRRGTSAAMAITGAGLSPLGAVVIAFVAILSGQRWADYDLYWHLANGRLMVEGGNWPSPDRFSWSMAGLPYIGLSAQADRAFYLLWRAGGAQALGLAAAIGIGLALLPYALLIGRLRARPTAELVCLLLIAMALLPYRGTRPQMFGWILFGLIVYLVDRPFPWWKAAIVGGGLGLWANLHGTFQIGFAVVGVAAITWFTLGDRRSAGAASGAIVVGVAMSLVSPAGPHLWVYPFRSPANRTATFNPDWASLHPLSLISWAMGLLLVACLALGIWRTCQPRAIVGVGLVLPAIQLARFTPFVAPLLVGRLP